MRPEETTDTCSDWFFWICDCAYTVAYGAGIVAKGVFTRTRVESNTSRG